MKTEQQQQPRTNLTLKALMTTLWSEEEAERILQERMESDDEILQSE